MIKLEEPGDKSISLLIPPNYSTWQTIELSHQCAKKVIEEGIIGDFVECGVAAGNNFAAMCKAGRHGYGFDSFEGIPWSGKFDTTQPGIDKINEKNFPKIGSDILETSGVSSHSMEDVEINLKKWNVENYTLVKGWFQDTTYVYHRPISILRLDGDLYESTLVCLQTLYHKLSYGGILIIDDWILPGCRKAFDEYFDNGSFEMPTLIFDNGVTYWQK